MYVSMYVLIHVCAYSYADLSCINAHSTKIDQHTKSDFMCILARKVTTRQPMSVSCVLLRGQVTGHRNYLLTFPEVKTLFAVTIHNTTNYDIELPRSGIFDRGRHTLIVC
jgi:hypothetical protein